MESYSLETMTNSKTEDNNHINNFCEEDQQELVDSKEHFRDLFQNQQLSLNSTCKDGTAEHPCDHNEQLNDLDIKITKCIEQNNQTHLKLEGLRKTVDILLHRMGLNEEKPFDHPTEANDVDDGRQGNEFKMSSKLDKVDGNISKCILSNELTHLKIDNLQKSLDLILNNIENYLLNSEASAAVVETFAENENYVGFRFPISTVNELNRLDEELQQNDDLIAKLINKFTKIAGDSGNKSARKVGVKIIERIISARLLTKFTWTGRTNGTNNTKLPFITYSSIFHLCLQVISKADRSFDTKACENFLKNNVLKHSSMRLSRKFNKKKKPKEDKNWCSSSKSEMQTPSKRKNIVKQKSDTDFLPLQEEIIDSKENIRHLLEAQKEEPNNSPELEENSFPKKCDHEDKLNILGTKISYCIDSNTKFHSKIDNMQETLNAILNKISKHNGCDLTHIPVPAPSSFLPSDITNDDLESFYFPITTVSGLQNLNKRLSMSESFEEKMIRKFMSVVGHTSHVSTQRFGLEVVESVISPQLLMKYSWTGRSKGIKPKLAFMKYKCIVSFFQKIIAKIDKHFTPKECKDFLRLSVFKYVNIRVARTRRKIKVPLIEYYSDQDNNQELSTMTTSNGILKGPDED
ncbi:uncharacterized protein LOC129952547 [Eupeodes corollae]|uniref:uncharacterized protein LOC129952547 n=1 Tax=Eupeodes corollae TaxID=290404 RepID=UPI0024922B8C|nr:uncharacterized protein LOC129952547 [Eupeodes corollae]